MKILCGLLTQYGSLYTSFKFFYIYFLEKNIFMGYMRENLLIQDIIAQKYLM